VSDAALAEAGLRLAGAHQSTSGRALALSDAAGAGAPREMDAPNGGGQFFSRPRFISLTFLREPAVHAFVHAFDHGVYTPPV
jgi:hypothetical protein